jgi:hypothetical protein
MKLSQFKSNDIINTNDSRSGYMNAEASAEEQTQGFPVSGARCQYAVDENRFI